MTSWILAADIVAIDGSDMSASLRGSAAKFRPHVTLRGRFRCSRANCDALLETLKEASTAVPGHIQLAAPARVPPDMVWLECLPGFDGFSAICTTHLALDAALRRRRLIEHDETPPNWQGAGFRPHVTLSWGAGPIGRLQPAPISVRPIALALYFYNHSPEVDEVRRIQAIPLPACR